MDNPQETSPTRSNHHPPYRPTARRKLSGERDRDITVLNQQKKKNNQEKASLNRLIKFNSHLQNFIKIYFASASIIGLLVEQKNIDNQSYLLFAIGNYIWNFVDCGSALDSYIKLQDTKLHPNLQIIAKTNIVASGVFMGTSSALSMTATMLNDFSAPESANDKNGVGIIVIISMFSFFCSMLMSLLENCELIRKKLSENKSIPISLIIDTIAWFGASASSLAATFAALDINGTIMGEISTPTAVYGFLFTSAIKAGQVIENYSNAVPITSGIISSCTSSLLTASKKEAALSQVENATTLEEKLLTNKESFP